MKRAGTMDLLLHGGKAPPWLVKRMRPLARRITEIIVMEFGVEEFIRRLSDPMWFQALSYVLGYDWDSSGVTTVTTAVLRDVLDPELGIVGLGGKGLKSKETPNEIMKLGEVFGFNDSKLVELVRASRLAAKVDSALVQDGHELYHHTIFISKSGSWTIIQQGMNTELKSARRYHWYSGTLSSFVVDPHEIIGSIRLPFVLNIATSKSVEAQKVSLDLIREGPTTIKRDLGELLAIKRGSQSLDSYFGHSNSIVERGIIDEAKIKLLPTRINWRILEKAYELQPSTYEEFVELRGVGPAIVRALALVAELIYRAELSWLDPLRYTYAHGGKDGIPYPVNVKRMERTIEYLTGVIEELRLNKKEKVILLRRLAKLLPTSGY